MKHYSLICLLAFTLSSAVFAAEDVSQQFKSIAPEGILILKIEEIEGFLAVSGTAENNTQISQFMRAISQSEIGFPELQEIKQERGFSRFILRVKVS